jgi:hypothetical protein
MPKIALEIHDNVDTTIPLSFTDQNEVPRNFTGSTFRLDVKSRVTDASAIISLTSGSGIEHVDLTNGLISIKFSDYALSPGEYVYDLVEINGSSRSALFFGPLTVVQGVTGL